MSDAPPPGWYPDTEQHGQERWWNGQSWGDERRPHNTHLPAAPPPSAPAAPRPPSNRPARIALILAVAAFVLGCVPFVGFLSWIIAVAAIVFAVIGLTRAGLPKGAAIAGLVVGALALIVGPSVAVSSVVNVAQRGTPIAAASSPVPASAEAPPSEAGSTQPSVSPEPSETPSAPPKAKPKVYTGTGDDVLRVKFTEPVVAAFSCAGCSGNTVLKTDSGSDTLVVNTIGAYTGRHLLNRSSTDLLTRFTINADAKWKLTVTPVVDAVHLRIDNPGQTVKGTGDDVLFVGKSIEDAKIVNHAGAGSGNFVVLAYGDAIFDNLAVNEIGSYSGTVPLQGAAIVQVESDGKWTITGRG